MEDVSIIGLDIAKTTFQAHGATVDGGQRGKGKRGGGRAIYVLMVSEDLAIMIMAYTKNEQSDLTQHQRKAILSLLEEFGK